MRDGKLILGWASSNARIALISVSPSYRLAVTCYKFILDVALQDYTKYILYFSITHFLTNPRRYKASLNPEPEPESQVPAEVKKDYSLKEGQTFSITLPGRSKASTTGASLIGSSGSGGLSSGGGIPLLPPPPSAPKKY